MSPLPCVNQSQWFWLILPFPFRGSASLFGVCDLGISDSLSHLEWCLRRSRGAAGDSQCLLLVGCAPDPGAVVWVTVSHMCVKGCACRICANVPLPAASPQEAVKIPPLHVGPHSPCGPAAVAVPLCHVAACKVPTWVGIVGQMCIRCCCFLVGGDPRPTHCGCHI